MKISVIIPTYNEAKSIVATLEQFQAVRGVDVELIVTDNGSSDSTRMLARELADKVVALPTDLRSTIGECRNRGARAATGDILWFIDADVRIPNINAVRVAIINEFARNEAVIAILLPLGIYANEVRFWDKFWFRLTNIAVYIQNSILHTGAAPGDCQIILRREFERVKGFNPELTTAEDFDLFSRLIKNGKVKTLWRHPVEMSPRRIRQDGWPRILNLWVRNYISRFIFKRVNHDEWIARR